jgi:hypothetical protein
MASRNPIDVYECEFFRCNVFCDFYDERDPATNSPDPLQRDIFQVLGVHYSRLVSRLCDVGVRVKYRMGTDALHSRLVWVIRVYTPSEGDS